VVVRGVVRRAAVYNYTSNPNNDQFTYFVWAAACATVELDVLSGDCQIVNVDIVYDNGNSLNPAVDIGQIEGAFVMGLGFFFTGWLLPPLLFPSTPSFRLAAFGFLTCLSPVPLHTATACCRGLHHQSGQRLPDQ
jgi:hypothetical protein